MFSHDILRIAQRILSYLVMIIITNIVVFQVACTVSQSAFSASFRDNVPGDIKSLLTRIERIPDRQEKSIAIGLTPEPTQLYAFDIPGKRVIWNIPIKTSITPVVAGDYVITQEGNDFIGRGISDGKHRFKLRLNQMTLVGADAQEQIVALTFTKGRGINIESALIIVRNNSVAWNRSIDGPVGVPAVIGESILVPWNHQNLSEIDQKSGNELARIRLRDTIIGYAFVDQNRVFAGSEQGIFEITENLTSGMARQTTFFSLPERTLPGQPELLYNIYSSEPIPPPTSARNNIQLAWRPRIITPNNNKKIELQDNNLYLVFYRFIVAFNPSTYQVKWIYTHPVDITGAQALEGGVMIGDKSGTIALISARSGSEVWSAQTGFRTLVLQLRDGSVASNFNIDRTLNKQELITRLVNAASDSDARLVPVRILAVELLAELDDANSTKHLIDLCDNRRISPSVRITACNSLANQKSGADQILLALKRHSSYLEGTGVPPVGPLAKAIANLKDKRAVALLISHLKDPNTPAQYLSEIVNALVSLNDFTAVDPLSSFLQLYHADASDEYLIEALGDAADALVKLSGPVSADVLHRVSQDVMVNPAVRERVNIALESLEMQKVIAEQNDKKLQEIQEEQAEMSQHEAEEQEEDIPKRLTQNIVNNVLLKVRDQMKGCLKSSKDRIFSARILAVVDTGETLIVSVVPKSLQTCIEPLVRSQKFPLTQIYGKESISYTIRLQ